MHSYSHVYFYLLLNGLRIWFLSYCLHILIYHGCHELCFMLIFVNMFINCVVVYGRISCKQPLAYQQSWLNMFYKEWNIKHCNNISSTPYLNNFITAIDPTIKQKASGDDWHVTIFTHSMMVFILYFFMNTHQPRVSCNTRSSIMLCAVRPLHDTIYYDMISYIG